MEESPFIRVNGNDVLLANDVPYPEFVQADLLPDADDLSHGAAAVTAALAYKDYCGALLFCRLVPRNG